MTTLWFHNRFHVRVPGIVVALIVGMLLIAACGQPSSAPADPTASDSLEATSPAETAEAADEAALRGELFVFAAASLTEAYQELENTFELIYPDLNVTLNLAGSQQLAHQLTQGAPADVFASANTRQMDVAIEDGRVLSDTQRIFAHNRLVVVVSNSSEVAVEGLEDLTRPDLKLILAAKEVPVGRYSLDFLTRASTRDALGPDYQEQVLDNVVSYEQTVKAVLTKVVLGEGDAGIVYSSDLTADTAESITTIDIPDELNTIATYPIAVVTDSTNPEAARSFVAFVLSADGQAVMEKHGFLPAE